ncbi:hypothetical protein C2I33_07725 [Ralstonia solanacearum]|nr:hypothetical protein C2I33_07725 [Ralstonia solanacearum]
MSTLHPSPASSASAGDDPVARDGESLRAALAADLRVSPEQLGADSNLLELGLDSMRLMACLNRLRSCGYTLTMRELYREPTLAAGSS